MNVDFTRGLTLVTAIAAGVSAGVFFAFSTFIMKALNDRPPAQAIAAMNAINKHAPNGWFMLALFGGALGCVVLIVASIVGDGGTAATYRIVGGALFLVCAVLTMAYHVPQNDALMALDPGSAAAAHKWAGYYHDWTLWNHVRTLSALAGAVALTLAYRAD